MLSTTWATGVIPSDSRFLSISCLSFLWRPDTAARTADWASATSLSFCLAAFSALMAANLAFFLSSSALRSAIT